jgi:hypothetical protein
MREIQYWLAELGPHDLPKLIDGPHSRRSGDNRAAYLIRGIGLGPKDRRFAVARVELTDCEPTSLGVNQKALNACKKMVESMVQ